MSNEFFALLAQAPLGPMYADPFKILGMVAGFVLWALFAQWVDKDAIRVNTFRQVWNMVVLISGAVAVTLLVLLPVFWAGMAAFVVVNGAVIIAYVVHRNGLVEPENRVCTPGHMQRLMSREGRAEKLLEVHERVVLRDSTNRGVPVPMERDERAAYAVAQEFLFQTLYRRANVTDLIPAGEVCQVRVSVDGVARTLDSMPRANSEAVLHFLKKIAGLNLEERRKPQRGRIFGAIGPHSYELVVLTHGSSAGERLSLRALGEERNYKIQDIGLTNEQIVKMREVMDLDHGLVLCTSLPHHGLTTTLYSILRSHDAFLYNIQTLERDVEQVVENITQNRYEPSETNPFDEAVRRVMRTDPDIVCVPDISDAGSAKAVNTAGSAKQLVYVGVPAADAFDGLRRWITISGEQTGPGKAVAAILHQRLVRKLCEACKAAYKPDPATLKKLNLPPDKVLFRPPEPQYDKQGNQIVCPQCQGANYVGRTGIFSLLVVDEALRKAVVSGAGLVDIQSIMKRMPGLDLQGPALQKVFQGVTSIEEVVRVTRPPTAGKGSQASESQATSRAAG